MIYFGSPLEGPVSGWLAPLLLGPSAAGYHSRECVMEHAICIMTTERQKKRNGVDVPKSFSRTCLLISL